MGDLDNDVTTTMETSIDFNIQMEVSMKPQAGWFTIDALW